MSQALFAPLPPATDRPARPLRVLLVTEAAGGGVGRHFLDLARGLAAKGVQVQGIYSPGRMDALFRERLQTEEFPPLHELPMRRAIHPLDARDAWRLTRRIRELAPFDILHGHSSKAGALVRLAGRWLGIPTVYTPHALVTLDPTLPAWKRAFYGRIERFLSHWASAIIAVSPREADHALTLGLPAKKLHVVPNGIDRLMLPDRELVRAKLGLAPDEVAIGFIGRLSKQKAPEVMLEAFHLVSQHCPQARLVMIGSGPMEEQIRAQVRQLALESRVRLLGDVVATEYMSAMDLFCLPSRYEGMPYVLLEALAAGLPIVATNVGGVAMTVEHGRNGLIVPPCPRFMSSAEPLAAALRELASDTEKRAQFAAVSAERSEQFSIEAMVTGTIAIYRQVLAGVRSASKR